MGKTKILEIDSTTAVDTSQQGLVADEATVVVSQLSKGEAKKLKSGV